ncbi:MAG: ATP-binding protein [Novosphingobium sp.]
MLGQAAGENVDITFDIADDLHPVLTDRNQLENALLNLVLNARDAMPAGGTVGIAARNRENEVEIVVRDEGTGMDEATLEKAAEPFFTTKPIGSGSGLGLSQVYGFLHQIGGRLQISSTPGTGTTVRLFLSTEREAHGARLAG